MIIDKDTFRIIVYLSVVIIVVTVGLFAWFKGR